jgi:ATP-dependent helicase/nuclease subunit A
MLTIYRASAGTGKTHIITQEYLKIALRSPTSFKKILAVTFTNKATNEMKQRIIASLHDICQGKITPIAQELMTSNNWDHLEIIKRAKNLITQVLHNYSSFAISTIDSFFQKVINAFLKELELSHNFTIELDTEKAIEEIVNETFIESNNNSELREWLLEFSEYKMSNSQTWNIRKEMQAMCKQIFSDLFKKHEKEIITFIEKKDNILLFTKTIDKLINNFEKQLQILGEQASKLISDDGLLATDFAFGLRGPVGYLYNIEQKKSFEPSKRAVDAINNIDKWSSKKSDKKQQIDKIVNEQLNNILKQAIDIYNKDHVTYNTAIAIKKLLHSLYISIYMINNLQEYKRANNIMFLSDLTQLLKDIISQNPTPFIYEKIGTRYKHFFIDEFQDISEVQWKNFSPLIQNSISENNANLIVGDAKQSIYRWRGGDTSIFLEHVQNDVGETNIRIENLNTSWRSSPEVVNFTNKFFKDSVSKLADHITSQEPEDQKDILKKYINQHIKAYQHCDLTPANPEIKGKVKIKFFEDNEQNWQKKSIAYTLKKIEKLQTKYQVLPEQICILTRNNKEAREILRAINHHKSSSQSQPYKAISTEAININNTPWIRIQINTLKWLIDLASHAETVEIAYLYHSYIKESLSTSMISLINVQDCLNFVPEDLINNKDSLKQMRLHLLIKSIEKIFGIYEIEDAKPFLAQFRDLVIEYEKNHGNSIKQFLIWWSNQQTAGMIKLEPQKNNVNIMTIHQAKGLEFEAVIIPFCYWHLDHNAHHAPVLWCENMQENIKLDATTIAPIVPIKYNHSLTKSIYKYDYYNEKVKTHFDNLNLLYVAFTRAKKYMYVLTTKPKTSTLSTTANLLLEHSSEE